MAEETRKIGPGLEKKIEKLEEGQGISVLITPNPPYSAEEVKEERGDKQTPEEGKRALATQDIIDYLGKKGVDYGVEEGIGNIKATITKEQLCELEQQKYVSWIYEQGP